LRPCPTRRSSDLFAPRLAHRPLPDTFSCMILTDIRIRALGRAAALLAGVLLAAPPAQAQTAESEYDGATALGLTLRRLGNTARVLVIAAHPDDENTPLLGALAPG